MELDENLYDQIVMICDEGDALSEDGEVEQAVKKYLTALKLVPLPKKEWEASI